MHYRDGTPAQLGDVVKGTPDWVGHEIIGEVVSAQAGADSCNLSVRAIARRPCTEFSIQAAELMQITVSAKDFELVSRGEFKKPAPPAEVEQPAAKPAAAA